MRITKTDQTAQMRWRVFESSLGAYARRYVFSRCGTNGLGISPDRLLRRRSIYILLIHKIYVKNVNFMLLILQHIIVIEYR